MEGVLGAPAMAGGIRQRIDDVEQFEHGSWPAVRDDQRQGVRMARLDLDEMNVHAVDRRHELRKSVQLRLGFPPVVVGFPVADELLECRELHTLRTIPDELLGGPARGSEPPAQIDEVRLRHVDPKRPDRGVGVLAGCRR
jgi:hypothetical protein